MDELELLMHDYLTGLINGKEFATRFLAFREVILIEQDRAMYEHPTLAKSFERIDRWSGILPAFMWRKRYQALCAQITNCRIQPMSEQDKLLGEVYKAVETYIGDDQDLRTKIEALYEKLRTLQTK